MLAGHILEGIVWETQQLLFSEREMLLSAYPLLTQGIQHVSHALLLEIMSRQQ